MGEGPPHHPLVAGEAGVHLPHLARRRPAGQGERQVARRAGGLLRLSRGQRAGSTALRRHAGHDGGVQPAHRRPLSMEQVRPDHGRRLHRRHGERLARRRWWTGCPTAGRTATGPGTSTSSSRTSWRTSGSAISSPRRTGRTTGSTRDSPSSCRVSTGPRSSARRRRTTTTSPSTRSTWRRMRAGGCRSRPTTRTTSTRRARSCCACSSSSSGRGRSGRRSIAISPATPAGTPPLTI